MHHARVSAPRARELLIQHKGSLRAIIGDVTERTERSERSDRAAVSAAEGA
jgi:hypothetical protein